MWLNELLARCVHVSQIVLVYFVTVRQGKRVIWSPLAMKYYDNIQVRRDGALNAHTK